MQATNEIQYNLLVFIQIMDIAHAVHVDLTIRHTEDSMTDIMVKKNLAY